ncbi:MAG TPA: hypothetical protein PK728_12470 [Bacillota bacterium]|nr:hypothetical protein [Bacillota bacterium]
MSGGKLFASLYEKLYTRFEPPFITRCRLNRDSMKHFRQAGFRLRSLSRLSGGILPVVMGTGTKLQGDSTCLLKSNCL